MKEQKNESKYKLFNAIFYAVSAMILGILAVVDFISQKELPDLMHIGLILVWVGMAINSYTKYRKDKGKIGVEHTEMLETDINE